MSKCPPSHNKAGARSPADVAPSPLGSVVSTGLTIFAEFTRLADVTLITCLTISASIASFKSLADFKSSAFLLSGGKRRPAQRSAQWSVTYKRSDPGN